MTTPKPSASRVAALRERRAALGLVRVEVWVRPEDADRIRALARQSEQPVSAALIHTASLPPITPA